MGDCLHNLPVLLALVGFGFTYLIAAVVHEISVSPQLSSNS